ncbi:sensor histidine kinase [Pimelobacter simplex]|uniref:sensor histidine kinase n=1 Tax=Nocardioides simplex TaxID=2045 RepID=UPI003AAFCA03
MRRWSELSEVERVDVYTRQSLYLLLWFFVGTMCLSAIAQEPVHRTAYVVAGAGILVLTAVATSVLRAGLDQQRPWRRIALLLGLSAVAIAVVLPQPDAVRATVVLAVFVNVAWSLSALRGRWLTIALIVGLGVLMGATTGRVALLAGGMLLAAFCVFTVRASLWLLGVVTELDQARSAQAALAVAEERLRFSRDVHDVMGRRLSAIAVQAELAASLADRHDPRAAAQILAVRGVAHDALREARELARGYRPTDLHQELEGARSLLRSAGIDVRLDVAEVPAPWQEPAAWIVREAVTNVLRHSAATQVAITFRAEELSVTNDGVTASPPGGTGLGLDGLRERLAPLGATLTTSADVPSFRLTARFADPLQEIS